MVNINLIFVVTWFCFIICIDYSMHVGQSVHDENPPIVSTENTRRLTNKRHCQSSVHNKINILITAIGWMILH